MSLPTDFAIVDADGMRGYSHLLVEAVELHGGAILRAAYVPPPYIAAGTEVTVLPIDVPALETAFTAARRQTRGPDYHDARHAPKTASEPLKPGAPVRYRPGGRAW